MDVLDRLNSLLDADEDATSNTSMRLPTALRDAAAVAAPVRNDEPAIRRFTTEQFSRHHGTTLGLHSPGGPQS